MWTTESIILQFYCLYLTLNYFKRLQFLFYFPCKALWIASVCYINKLVLSCLSVSPPFPTYNDDWWRKQIKWVICTDSCSSRWERWRSASTLSFCIHLNALQILLRNLKQSKHYKWTINSSVTDIHCFCTLVQGTSLKVSKGGLWWQPLTCLDPNLYLSFSCSLTLSINRPKGSSSPM